MPSSPTPTPTPASPKTPHRRGVLDLIERIGNALPDPVMLFLGAAILVALVSALASSLGWSVQPLKPAVLMVPATEAAGAPIIDAASGKPALTPALDPSGKPRFELQPSGDPIKARSLLSSDGAYWALTSMVRNFINFPPLGMVLTAMLGIGIAEKVGLFAVAMRWLAGLVPSTLLTPMIVFLGIMSNVASDAGYIVLPPLAAGLYLAVGRSPVVGIAAAFAGVSAGFSANLLIGAGDALVSGITQIGAQVVDPRYTVNATCNWTFMAASTFVLTFVAWGVTAWLIEPRFNARSEADGGPAAGRSVDSTQRLTPGESRALRWAGLSLIPFLALTAALILIPGAPLYGAADDKPGAAARWTQAIVPIVLLAFLVPGLAYGLVSGQLRSQSDVAKAFTGAIAGMAPIIVLAFFAAQFIEYFRYSNLDRMLAFVGGEALVEAGLSPHLMLIGIILLTLVVNLFIGSMSAKWAMLAPILVPMLMIAGFSPELTQAAYRVGDSVTNTITPLNSYLLIVLVVVQRHWKSAGMGSLISLMIPYSVVFALIWSAMLVAWVSLGLPIGPDAPLSYPPAPAAV